MDAGAARDGVARLGVSSAGASRPVGDIRQYAKHRGRVLAIKHTTNGAVSGILQNVFDDSLELDVNGTREIIPFNQIVEGKVALPW